jgi:hypothetical protein
VDEPTAFALSTWFDDVAPVLDLPAPTPIVVEAQTASGAIVTFSVSATDNSSAPVNVACSPASGALFPFNGSSPTTTTVSCVATDASGNPATGSFDVVVRDTTAPQVITPQITIAATEAAGARGNVPVEQAPHAPILQQVPLLAAAVDAGDANPTRVSVQWVDCSNHSLVRGPIADTTLYPVGPNCFQYVFRDASANVGTGIGTIEVSPPIGGHVNVANVAVTATDLNNVPLPVTATFLALDQPGLLTAVPPPFIPPPPAGFIFADAPLDIRSTALAPQAVVVCRRPPLGQFADRLLLWESFQWVDRTNTIDSATGEICGHPGPLGTFALARPDLPPLSLTITPQSASRDYLEGHVIDVQVSDQSNPHSRVTFTAGLPLIVELRHPLAPNSPLSATPHHDGTGTLTGFVVSLGTDAGGQLVSTAAQVARLIFDEAIFWPGGGGGINASIWPGTTGAGIVAPSAPRALTRLSVYYQALSGVPRYSTYSSLPGRVLLNIAGGGALNTTDPIVAHLDSDDDGVVDPGELVTAADVTWADLTPPVVTVPYIEVPATSPAGATVDYVATAVDAVSGPAAVSCTIPSGATFPVGGTFVTCTATDAAGNEGAAIMTVWVTPFVPPATPVISSLSPSSAVAGEANTVVTVTGSGFASGATAFWNGLPRPTIVNSATHVTMTVLASDLATTAELTTVLVTVSNLDTPVSNALPFVITSPQVVTVDAEIAPPGGTVTAANAPTLPGRHGASATLTNNDPASSPATVAVASYATNPVGDATFAAGGFFDIQVTGADATDSLTAQFYYPTTVTGRSELLLELRYWDGLAWTPVVGAGGVPPVKDTTNNLDGTTSGGRFTVTLDDSSVPRLTDLSGTVFALVEEEDLVAPVTTLEQSPAANAAGWNNTDVTLTLEATDDRTGVSRTEFSVNNGSWRTYGGPVVFDNEGSYVVRYRSVDEAGNVERAKATRVRIDKTEPLAIAVALPTVLLPANRRMVDITVLPLTLDLLSGVDELKLVSVTSDDPGMTADDVAGWTTGTKDTRGRLRAERTASGDRRIYSLTYRVTDRAGNEALATALVIVPGARD